MYALNGIKISHLWKQKIKLNIAWRGAMDFLIDLSVFFSPPRIDMIKYYSSRVNYVHTSRRKKLTMKF